MAAAVVGVLAAAIVANPGGGELPEIRVDRDDVRITSSCRLLLPEAPIIDANGDGVIHVVGDDLVVDLGGGTLLGRSASTAPWDRSGLGIVARGRGITLRNGSVSGFQVGVLAAECDGFTAEDLDLSGNWGARLRSGASAEDGADWLWPHANDSFEWRTRYGAALCVERSRGVTVRRVKAIGRGAQNGIVLDRVEDSSIYDNDCSFLSGWGVAMWRSSRNIVTRNAFDFCVRGYSHGVYNRGQDSAGILMFEQCSENLIALNSATHCGDGIFIFAGNEALGPDLPAGAGADHPAVVAARRRGCNGNVIAENDFSFAVAHGIEITFSFDNVIARNQLVGCGITGLWGGYSRRCAIVGNVFEANGVHAENPGEEAGVSAEHAEDLLFSGNQFRRQGVAIKLWWDEDEGLARKAWSAANGAECGVNRITGNRFVDCGTGIRIRRCPGTRLGANSFASTGREVDADEASEPIDDRPKHDDEGRRMRSDTEQRMADASRRRVQRMAFAKGERHPVGARVALGGREAIIITAEGPYDWSRPLLVRDSARSDLHEWRLLGPGKVLRTQISGRAGFELAPSGEQRSFRVRGHPGWVAPYRLVVELEGAEAPLVGTGTIVSAPWSARFFAWTADPRQDLDGWRRESEAGVTVELPSLDLRYGNGGPSQVVREPALERAALPSDRFGMIATTRLSFPPGRWRLRVLSDDGVRLRVDGHSLVDRWNWHAPTEDLAEIVTDQPREVEIVVEHFELDGFAVLALEVEPMTDAPAPPATPPARAAP